MEIPKNKDFNYKGSHVLADFTGVTGDENKIGKHVFNLMIKAIERTTMKIVHKHLQILNQDTPPGFCAFLLLDSSHFSSHSYTIEGLMSCDIYTCGPTDPFEVMTYFKEELMKEFPDMKCTYMNDHKRFRY
jgi:S-adenosylmethionine/arginine decarboxylase-like enzyme